MVPTAFFAFVGCKLVKLVGATGVKRFPDRLTCTMAIPEMNIKTNPKRGYFVKQKYHDFHSSQFKY